MLIKTFLLKKLRFKRAFALVLSLMFCSALLGQISGVVTDAETGEPLIGATVLVNGSSNGTITDIDGSYTIDAKSGDVINFSYTGFTSQDITVGDSNRIDVTLTSGVLVDEIVVTGYTVDTRRSTPGSVSTIKAADLQVSPSGNVEQQLQGRVPGVTVITNGQPGTTSQVRVRGYGALGGNAPLYIVDGVPVGSTDFLPPNDIATTTVLKDATSASIYGARAAGGVIVYTTKQGEKKNQPLKITYNGLFGVTTPGAGPGVLNPQQQADWTRIAIRNGAIQNGVDLDSISYSHPQYGSGVGEGYTPTLPDYLRVGGMSGVTGNIDLTAEEALYNIDPELGGIYQVIRANKEGTDWYDAITRNALLNRHNLGFSGGSEKGRYYVGLGMQEQEGILIHQKFTRYNLRLNTEFDLSDKLSIGENIQVTYRSVNVLQGDSGGAGSSDDESVLLAASRMSPIIPVYDEFGGYAGTAASGFNNAANPVAQLDGQQNDRNFQTSIFGNIYLNYRPIENLTLRTSFGGRHFSAHQRGYSRRTYENQENNSSFGFFQNSFFGTGWNWTNTASYKMSFGDSNLDLLVGQEALNTGSNRATFASGINPFSQSTDFVGLSTVSSQVVNGGHFDGVTFSSLFGKVKYDYKDKYILSAVVRRDGSSRFGAENRYGVFPAFSAAWRLTGESFMENQNIFDDLKIRGGWGVMGNSNNVDPNNQFSLFGTSIGASSYDISGSNSSAAQGFFRTRIGNPFARWEKAITANIGIDALLMDGKLDIGVEYWTKTTEDLLFQQPVSVMTGPFANAPSVNVGEMKNTGLDLTIKTLGGSNDFSYEIGFNGGFLSNEIVALSEGITSLPNRSSGYRGIVPVLNQVGESISSFYGYEVERLFSEDDKVDGEDRNVPLQDAAAPGRFKFADIDGNDTINLLDRKVLGSPVPDFTAGLNIKVNYKQWGIEVYTFASVGNEIYNMSKVFTDFYPLFPGAAISDRVLDSWSFDNPSGEIPIFETNSNFSTNTQSNSFYVEDGSYLRLQNITLSYHLGQNLLDKLNVENVRIYGGVNNIFTITGYSGLDPSVGGAADTNFGVDLGNFPITRSWTVGLDVDF